MAFLYTNFAELAATVRMETVRIAHKIVALSLHEGTTARPGLGLGASAHAIDDLAEVGDEMKLSKTMSVWGVSFHGSAIGSAAINAHGGHAGLLLGGTFGKEAL